MKIVVVGGTGLIGSKVVRALVARGHDAIAAAPSTGVDTITGEGLSEALSGASVVIDVSNAPALDASAVDFFTTATTNLLNAETAAGVSHHVALSVVGTDRLAPHDGYFQAKLIQEQLIADAGVPYTIVHATQFFEFIGTIADSATDGDTVRLPSALFQPMASGDVAEAVATAALADPRGGIVEVAGPERYGLDELIRTALAARGDTRRVVTDPAARYWGIQVGERTLLPGEGAVTSGTRYSDWVLEQAVTGGRV